MDTTLTQIADRFDRHADRFTRLVAGVPDDAWAAATPCGDWTVTDLVAHVVDTQGMFQQMVGRQPAATPPVADRPVDAVRTALGQTLADLRAPERAQVSYEGAFGTKTFAWAVDTFLTFDLIVHGWDLARATGQDETIPADEIPALFTALEGWGDMARGPGAFGPPLEVSADVDDQTRLLALLGRRA